MRIAGRANAVCQSDIRRMTDECRTLGGVNLGQGLCRLPTPDFVRRAAVRAIEGSGNLYSPAKGRAELLEGLLQKIESFNGITLDSTEELLITAGATGAFTCAINALLEPGDGILLFEPFYPYHRNASLVAGLDPQYIELREPEWRIEESTLEAAVQPNTRALVLCTPSNPSGRVFDEAELKIVARVAAQHDLLVISDEIYEYITFDTHRHLSPASLSDLRQRTLMISGFSKTFSVTGWRIGYVVGPREMVAAVQRVHDTYFVCAATPLQLGVSQGCRIAPSYFESMRQDYAERRDRLADALLCAGLEPNRPEGAYYLWADTTNWGFRDSRDAANFLLKSGGVASVPGSAFYSRGQDVHRLRFCFALEDELLDEACKRLSSLSSKALGNQSRRSTTSEASP